MPPPSPRLLGSSGKLKLSTRTATLLHRQRVHHGLIAPSAANMYTLSPQSPVVGMENPLILPRRTHCTFTTSTTTTTNPTVPIKASLRQTQTPLTTFVRTNSTASKNNSGRTDLNFRELAEIYPRGSRKDNEDLWYVLTAACLIAWRREAAVADLWTYLTNNPPSPPPTKPSDSDTNASDSNPNSGDTSSTSYSKPNNSAGYQTSAEQFQQSVLETAHKLKDKITTSTTPTTSTAPPTQSPTEKSLLKSTRRIREGLLKSSVLVGFPRAINGLSSLHRSIKHTTPSLYMVLSDDASLRAPVSAEVKSERGRKFFEKIYDKHTELVLANMSASSGGDLSYYAVASIYGDLMAEVGIIDAAETVLLEFACCLAGGCGDQAKGHMYGSRNHGATGEEIRGVIELVEKLGRQVGAPIDEYYGEMPWLEKARGW